MADEFKEGKGRIDRTFTGKRVPTGKKVHDVSGVNAEPGVDVGASELPLRGDAGFPGSPNEAPEDRESGPRDIGSEPAPENEK